MTARLTRCLALLLALSLVATLGCGAADNAPPAGGTASGTAATGNAAADPDDEIALAMAELSPEDRTLAMAQKLCPVGDSPLGSMGKPVKVSVKGRAVFLCCDGCERAVKEDPDAILAKLDAAADQPAAETN